MSSQEVTIFILETCDTTPEKFSLGMSDFDIDKVVDKYMTADVSLLPQDYKSLNAQAKKKSRLMISIPTKHDLPTSSSTTKPPTPGPQHPAKIQVSGQGLSLKPTNSKPGPVSSQPTCPNDADRPHRLSVEADDERVQKYASQYKSEYSATKNVAYFRNLLHCNIYKSEIEFLTSRGFTPLLAKDAFVPCKVLIPLLSVWHECSFRVPCA